MNEYGGACAPHLSSLFFNAYVKGVFQHPILNNRELFMKWLFVTELLLNVF